VSTGTLLSERAPAPVVPGRFIDRGSVFAGYVGIGMAIVVVIAFALIIPVQTLVFIAAPLCGLVIGNYANTRSGRWRPMRRVFANAAWAGFVTGLSIALMYLAIRLLFVFADTGQMPDGSVVSSGTTADGLPVACTPGPDCTYRRYFADPELEAAGLDLLSQGITDGDSFARAFVGQLLQGGAWIVILTVGGAVIAGGIRTVRSVPPEAVATGLVPLPGASPRG
jgi:hypothetical protein